MGLIRLAGSLLAAALVMLAAAPASAPVAPSRYVAIRGAAAPGPAGYDRVFVDEFGPANAKRVLVLVPGASGGAGSLSLLAEELVARIGNLQVWAVDHRTQALEDTSVFARGDPSLAYDYYLGARPVGGKRFTPVDGSTVPFARRWGLAVELGDLRQVVLAARAGGRKVILGGHSFGATIALAYASWDFAGRAGYRDLDGLVLLDGGGMSAFPTLSLARVKDELSRIEAGNPFWSVLPGAPPWAAGVLVQIAALFAAHDPDGASVLQHYPLLPPGLAPTFPVTNEALLGYAFDHATGTLPRLSAHLGSLAPKGEPRRWRNDELASVRSLAQLLAREPGNGVEWYYPLRLELDTITAVPLTMTPAARLLGLRLFHRQDVNLPLYAFATTSADSRRILEGARAFIAGSRTPRSRAVLASDKGMDHLDPIAAKAESNSVLHSLVPFLRGIG